jgi:predicted AAA+ superfamily ATPase
MNTELETQIYLLNPWLNNPKVSILDLKHYIPRVQATRLLSPVWDPLCLVLVGPRQAGKTTLGKYLCQRLLIKKRYKNLLYLNCDLFEIRNWLKSPTFVQEAMEVFQLHKPIIFIDEVQRLENPGLLLKSMIDLKLPIKLMASGSSQLEIKSKVQEYLTGRHFETIILPLSFSELGKRLSLKDNLIYGCYPQVVETQEKKIILQQLYSDYINKDIIEILKIGKPDVLQKLITLIAHSSGQLVNYNQLATDCRVSVPTIQNYLAIFEQTYVLIALKPFVGNKRTEITSNPIYYFIDNGFRNQALKNFIALENRTDMGLLVESAVFQELYKYKQQYFKDFELHYWRTKAGAEVDFVLYQNEQNLLPIEVKYRQNYACAVSRGFRSFIEAYQPKFGIYITANTKGQLMIGNCTVHFIPLTQLKKLNSILDNLF